MTSRGYMLTSDVTCLASDVMNRTGDVRNHAGDVMNLPLYPENEVGLPREEVDVINRLYQTKHRRRRKKTNCVFDDILVKKNFSISTQLDYTPYKGRHT